MKLELSEQTIVTLRTACRLMCDEYLAKSPDIGKQYEEAYQKLVNAHIASYMLEVTDKAVA